ncbi:MAG TPA: hypothetical protein VNE62_06595 [Actinomycetota bacterium]|nr:hypothetical protein [Actinomycetota bacterium]
MSMFRRLLCSAAAIAVAASIAPVAATPAQAANCPGEIIVFTYVSFPLPDNPSGRQWTPSATYNPQVFGCAASPDFEFNTALIYPGAQRVSSRLKAGAAGTYCFSGLLNVCSTATVREGTVPGTQYTESDTLVIDPTSVGCLTASFDNRGHIEYCTATELRP